MAWAIDNGYLKAAPDEVVPPVYNAPLLCQLAACCALVHRDRIEVDRRIDAKAHRKLAVILTA
jgi:hypothetical protein